MNAYCMTSDGRVYGNRNEFHGHLSGDCQPVVVISPEDREQVERLRDLFDDEVIRQNDDPDPRDVTPGARGNALQAALREFANPKPPRPEEPTGLGAVVEDEDGNRWVRSAIIRPGFQWHTGDAHSTGANYRAWSDIAAVTVLSEGVQ